jgi:hypothetical protein
MTHLLSTWRLLASIRGSASLDKATSATSVVWILITVCRQLEYQPDLLLIADWFSVESGYGNVVKSVATNASVT